jgi:hypothetical protein
MSRQSLRSGDDGPKPRRDIMPDYEGRLFIRVVS